MSNLLQNFSNFFLVIVLCVCVRNSFQTDPLGDENISENLQNTWRTTHLPSSNNGTNGKVKPPPMLGELPTAGDENISENLQYTWRTTHLPSSNKDTNKKVKPPTMLEELPTTGDENISENLQYTWRTTHLPSSNKGTNKKVKPPTMLEELPTTGDKNISYDSSGPSNKGKGHGEIPSETFIMSDNDTEVKVNLTNILRKLPTTEPSTAHT